MPNIKCLMLNIKCLMPNIKCLKHNIKCLMPLQHFSNAYLLKSGT